MTMDYAMKQTDFPMEIKITHTIMFVNMLTEVNLLLPTPPSLSLSHLIHYVFLFLLPYFIFLSYDVTQGVFLI